MAAAGEAPRRRLRPQVIFFVANFGVLPLGFWWWHPRDFSGGCCWLFMARLPLGNCSGCWARLAKIAVSLSSSAENSRFDAAQYTFFGKGPMEGPELGGFLEDGGADGDGGGFGGHDDGGYQFSSMGDEVRLSAPSYLAKLAS